MANEKRLISADPVANGIALYVAENAYLNDTALDALKMVAKWIEEAPTVDAVEVVHGRMRHVFFSYQSNHYECTCCGGTFLTNSAPHWNYCPNCGAKMDGGNGNV